ncbi:MAG: metallophosphoesterase, partial [Odoribacter sp.]|nr:metallophosphoesterase [Odoribacter sp.]
DVYTRPILHISDLHKNDGDDFENLYQSMVDDCNRYVKDGIRKPNIIVVSGDLITGGDPEEIKKQYDEVKVFLEKLTMYFLDNDKGRIVIVPGNHDVDWNVSKQLMSPLANESNEEKTEYNKNLDLFLQGKNSDLRWNWGDQRLYTIKDKETYNARFLCFAEFYKAFYGNRNYSLNPSEQYEIFDIPTYNICFVGFNSCYQNDHINKSGLILPTCVTNVKERIKERVKQGRILVAVWHHNTSGQPMVTNYLDNRILNPIIDMGVHIALHGHQHSSGVVEEYHNAFENGKLLMFSTGSLYGATETLAYGASRQYNILEIKVDEQLELRLHLREDNNSSEYGIPLWGNGLIKEIGHPSWTTKLRLPIQPLDEDRLSDAIQRGMETGVYADAIKMLREKAETDSAKRKMMLDFMMKGKQYKDILEYVGDPKTDEDALFVIGAAAALNDRAITSKVKAYSGIKASQNAQVRKMVDYL